MNAVRWAPVNFLRINKLGAYRTCGLFFSSAAKHVSNDNKQLYDRNTVPDIKAVIAKYDSSRLVKDAIVWTYLPRATLQ